MINKNDFKECPSCGANMYRNKGKNKAGKDFDGYFCENKDDCGNKEWIPVQKTPSKPTPIAPKANDDVKLLEIAAMMARDGVDLQALKDSYIFLKGILSGAVPLISNTLKEKLYKSDPIEKPEEPF